MGSTGDPSGEPNLAPCGPLTPSRKRGAGRKSAPATQPYIRPALSDLYHAQYRSLFRLAVLLTGVDGPAEAVVRDSVAALYRLRERPQTEDDAVPYLRRLLVAGHGWPGIISGTAAGGPRRGRGRLAALALRTKLCGPKARL